jgi:hypothetical protein
MEYFLLENGIRQDKMENAGILSCIPSLDLEQQHRYEISNTSLLKGGLQRCTELVLRRYSQLRQV